MYPRQRAIAIGFFVLSLLSSSCGSSAQSTPIATEVPPTATLSPTKTLTPIPTLTPTPTPTPPPLEVITEANTDKIANLGAIRFEGSEHGQEMAFSSNGVFLIVLSEDESQDVPTANVITRVVGTGEIVNQTKVPREVDLSSDGSQVIAINDEGISVYDVSSGQITSEQETAYWADAEFWLSPDRSRLVTKVDNEIEIWDVEHGQSVSKWTFDGFCCHTAVISQDNSTLAIRSYDDVFVYDTNTGELLLDILTTEASKDFFSWNIAISPNGAYVAVAGGYANAGGLQLWDVHNREMISLWNNKTRDSFHTGDIVISPDGQWMAHAIRNGSTETGFTDKVHLFDVKTGKLWKTLAAASGMAFSPDGRIFAAATSEGVVQLWSLKDGALLASLSGHGPQVEQILFSPSGTALASRGFENTILLWGIPPSGTSVARSGVSVFDQGIGFSHLDQEVPESWLAKGSSAPRYQIDLVLKHATLKSCPYTNNHTLYLQKQIVTATITDLEDQSVVGQKTFEGKYDSLTCPQTHTFVGSTGDLTVATTDHKEFKAWLYEIMTPLGFGP